jgi:hypothetical protein
MSYLAVTLSGNGGPNLLLPVARPRKHRDTWIHGVYPCSTLAVVKDAGIRIRVEKQLRSAFAAACQAEHKQASDVLREFMEAFVNRHQGGQGDLFSAGGDQGTRCEAGPHAPPT